MRPRATAINPGSGLKRIFGPTGWIELGKSLLKVVLLGAIGAWMLWAIGRRRPWGLSRPIWTVRWSHSAVPFVTLMFVMAGGLLLIAGIDLPIQIIRHFQQLKMSQAGSEGRA